MTALAKGNEPSMEEILASIRRIISDDEQVAAADKEEPAALPASVPAAPDVLDLAVEAKPLALAEESQGQDDIDLMFSDAELEPEPEPVPPPPPPVMADIPPPPPPAPPPQPVAPVAPAAYAVPEPAGELLSAAASASIAGAFSSLSNTLLTGNARTLEDLVKDMMKPMLKAWLDDNLPMIVERLVKAEIERVARGGR